jgi:ABC-type sugar transport system substrate-binding protein
MSTTDEAALGAIGAFASAGKTLKCNVDFGGNDEVLSDVKSGKMFASVALQFQADMAQSFDTLAKMQADPTAQGPVLTVPQKVITGNG